MRSLSIGIGVALAASAPAQALTPAAGCPAPRTAADTVPTFTSDFARAPHLDPKQWVPFTGQSVGDAAIEAQAYDPAQVGLVPGIGLRISALPGALLGKPYRSGALTTKDLFSQAYGRFEIMARLPQANGLWPAFWLLPATGGWPPEIDIIEYIYAPNGVEPAASAAAANGRPGSNPATTLHWGTAAHHSQIAPSVNSPIPQPMTYGDWNRTPPPAGFGPAYRGYHRYAIDWQPRSISWAIDGATVFCVTDSDTTGPRVPDGPMYMLINLAVSIGTKDAPQWAGSVEPGTSWPQTMDVLFVRVSQFKGPRTAPDPARLLPGGSKAPVDAASRSDGKVGAAEAKVLTTLSAGSADLCASGTANDFRAEPSGWRWICVGSGGGSTDPTGLAFRRQ